MAPAIEKDSMVTAGERRWSSEEGGPGIQEKELGQTKGRKEATETSSGGGGNWDHCTDVLASMRWGHDKELNQAVGLPGPLSSELQSQQDPLFLKLKIREVTVSRKTFLEFDRCAARGGFPEELSNQWPICTSQIPGRI
uniref:Uncharacterized protein n=1 Tax=Sphaerodactylus townsendi TaxID=933632 RepID=A0ACB8F1D4_9SAUR